MRVAERLGDAARLVGAHVALGVTLFFQGKLEPALAHFRRGFEMFDPNMQFPDWPGSHPGVQCQIFPMLISWMLGYPDRSLDELQGSGRKRRDARAPVDPRPNAVLRRAKFTSFATSHRRPPTMPDRALRICEEQRIAQWHAYCPLRERMGARRLWRKREGAGPNRPRGGRLRSRGGANICCWRCRPTRNWRSANPKRRLRRSPPGWRRSKRRGERRLKRSSIGSGARPCSPAPGRRARPRRPCEQGIDVARRQNAKSWELRGAMSLARLRRQQGRPQEAVALLAPILRLVHRRPRHRRPASRPHPPRRPRKPRHPRSRGRLTARAEGRSKALRWAVLLLRVGLSREAGQGEARVRL